MTNMSRKEVKKVLKLKEIREKKGLTQQELADFLGIHKITVSKYENEKLKLDQNNMVKMCIILDTTPNELLGFERKYKDFTDYLMSLKGEYND